MADLQEPFRYVKDLQGQLLVRNPALSSADGERTFQSGSGDFHEDISSQTYKTSIARIRASTEPLNPLIVYKTLDFGIPGEWQVDESDTTSEEDIGRVLVTAAGERLKNRYFDWVNVIRFGADPSGLSDNSAAFQKAIDFAASSNGGTILVPWGRYRFDSPVNLHSSGITILGIARQGKQFASVPSGERGTYIFPGAQFIEPIFNVVTGTSTKIRSCGIKNLSFVGGEGESFFYPIDYCIRVDCDQFEADGLSFEKFDGSCINIVRMIKGYINNLDISQCATVDRPALIVGGGGGVGGDTAQGSVFTNLRVESCNGGYIKINGAPQSKFDNIGIEGAPGVAQTVPLLDVDERCQFGKVHINKIDSTSTAPKVIIRGNYNNFGQLNVFGGHSDTVPEVVIEGSYNTILSYTTRSSAQNSVSLDIKGDDNDIASATLAFSDGLSVSGSRNSIRIHRISQESEDIIGGTENRLEYNCYNPLLSDYPVVVAGTRNKLRARIVGAGATSAAIRITGVEAMIADTLISGANKGISITGSAVIGDVMFSGVVQDVEVDGGSILPLRIVSPIEVPGPVEITGTVIDFSINGARFKNTLEDLTLSTSNHINGKTVDIGITNMDTNPHTVTVTGAPFPVGASNEIPAGGYAHISLQWINGKMHSAITIYDAPTT